MSQPQEVAEVPKRPLSLSILGWFFIVSDALNLIYQPMMLNSPTSVALLSQYRVPVGVTILVGMTVSLLCLVAGIAILKAKEWGRSLYVCASLAGIAVSLATMPSSYALVAVLPVMLLLGLFVFLLYRAPATAYFRGAKR
jgi:hypothetical protein